MELGMGEMQLYSEVEPGLPFGRLQGMGKGYWTVTKAGASEMINPWQIPALYNK